MNEYDAELYAEDKGIIDGGAGTWCPPFRSTYAPTLGAIYEQSYWLGFVMKVIEEEFPNG